MLLPIARRQIAISSRPCVAVTRRTSGSAYHIGQGQMPAAWCAAGGNRKRVRRYVIHRAGCCPFSCRDALRSTGRASSGRHVFMAFTCASGTGPATFVRSAPVTCMPRRCSSTSATTRDIRRRRPRQGSSHHQTARKDQGITPKHPRIRRSRRSRGICMCRERSSAKRSERRRALLIISVTPQGNHYPISQIDKMLRSAVTKAKG